MKAIENDKFFYLAGCDMLTILNADQTRAQFEAAAARIEGWYSNV